MVSRKEALSLASSKQGKMRRAFPPAAFAIAYLHPLPFPFPSYRLPSLTRRICPWGPPGSP